MGGRGLDFGLFMDNRSSVYNSTRSVAKKEAPSSPLSSPDKDEDERGKALISKRKSARGRSLRSIAGEVWDCGVVEFLVGK